MRLLLHSAALATLVAVASCISGDPAGPKDDVALEAVIYSGDGQVGEPGSELDSDLVVLVRRVDGEPLIHPVLVAWEVIEGEEAVLETVYVLIDGAQRARTRLTLGPRPGKYRVRARFSEPGTAPVEFTARAANRPVASSLEPGNAAPGEVVVVHGVNFLEDHGVMTVLFDGIRGETVDATPTTVSVRVPDCLSGGSSTVTVGVGALISGPLPLAVDESGDPISPAVGEVLTVDDPEALSCVRLEGAPARYLAVVHSAGTVGVVTHEFALALQIANGGAGAPESDSPDGPRAPQGPGSFREPESPQAAWEAVVRQREADAILQRAETAGGGRTAPPAGAASVVDPPEVGDRRSFDVLNGQGGFTAVEAEARFVGRHVVLYVDLDSPEGGFNSGDLQTLGDEFDDVVYPTIRQAYGQESDLDENERVVILFTPVVNGLTPSGTGGFVGGFFFGVDLLPERAGSNGGEIFYALVPDPRGEAGSPRSRDQVLAGVPAILAHEFQHMVHFNERILQRSADRAEAVWLSEALATMAEHLVGDVLASHGEALRAQLYWSANHARARRYLANPSDHSLLISQGSGSVEERGAGWLFLEHLEGRFGSGPGAGLLGELTRTTRTGTENVTAVVERPWEELVRPWTVALFLDGLAIATDPGYEFSTLDIRGTVTATEGYPLVPERRGGATGVVSGSIPSSTARYFELVPPAGGLAVSLAGSHGGSIEARSELAVSVVRLE